MRWWFGRCSENVNRQQQKEGTDREESKENTPCLFSCDMILVPFAWQSLGTVTHNKSLPRNENDKRPTGIKRNLALSETGETEC